MRFLPRRFARFRVFRWWIILSVVILGSVALFPILKTFLKCSCSRPYFYPRKPDQTFQSTCSDERTSHSNHQKVVSFSLFFFSEKDLGRKGQYKRGLLLNLQLMREYYRGFSIRVYTNEPIDEYCELTCNNMDLFWCDIGRTPLLGNMSAMDFRTWRFLPLADPTVDLFLVRDLDSVITEREAGAVGDWLQLGKSIHVMRDHQIGHNFSILGGLWGARNDLLGSERARKLRNGIIEMSLDEQSRHEYGRDQIILDKVLYPSTKKDIVAHVSYHCKYWERETLVRPFPIKRKNNVSDVVGNSGLGKNVHELPVCEEECRPSYGKDWDWC